MWLFDFSFSLIHFWKSPFVHIQSQKQYSKTIFFSLSKLAEQTKIHLSYDFEVCAKEKIFWWVTFRWFFGGKFNDWLFITWQKVKSPIMPDLSQTHNTYCGRIQASSFLIIRVLIVKSVNQSKRDRNQNWVHRFLILIGLF
jgi:hypothetical protein